MAAVLSDELKRSATRRWIIDDLFDCFPINGWNGGKKKSWNDPKLKQIVEMLGFDWSIVIDFDDFVTIQLK